MYVLTVKRPGGRTEHFAVEKRQLAETKARQLGAGLSKGGSVSILERTAAGLRLVGGLMKNPSPLLVYGVGKRVYRGVKPILAKKIGRQVEYIHDVLHGRKNPRKRRRRR